jgi:hypothetical protein
MKFYYVKYFTQYQMYILGHIAGGKWTGLNISLCAVNLAEACGDSMSMVQLAEVYATSATRLQINQLWKTLFLSVSKNCEVACCCFMISTNVLEAFVFKHGL